MTPIEWIAWGALFLTVALFGIENASTYGARRKGEPLEWVDYHALQLMQTGLVGLLAVAPALAWWEAYGAIVCAMPFFQGFINVGARLHFFDRGEDRTYSFFTRKVPKPIRGQWRLLQIPLGVALTYYTDEVLRWLSTNLGILFGSAL